MEASKLRKNTLTSLTAVLTSHHIAVREFWNDIPRDRAGSGNGRFEEEPPAPSLWPGGGFHDNGVVLFSTTKTSFNDDWPNISGMRTLRLTVYQPQYQATSLLSPAALQRPEILIT
jgi:hypothetical protein